LANPYEPLPERVDPEVPLSELEPAPEGDLLPGLELPPLPASPPEPGRAVPLVLAPLVPLGREDSEPEAELFMLLSLEPVLEPVSLVAAINGIDNAHVSPAIASAQLILFFMGSASQKWIRGGERWRGRQSF
jgi:hypothetical protein